MIFVHELGHFLAARACGVQVLEFAIGMGPAIFKHKSKRSGTVYSLRIIPLGGFNSLLGEDEEIELKGNYKVQIQIPKGSKDEIAQLANDFNTMTKEIESSQQMQKELIASISHDLRTPLTIIRGYAESIRDITGDRPEIRQQQLNTIIDETDRLSKMVNSVLEYARLNRDARKLNIVQYNMADMCSDIADIYSHKAESEGKDVIYKGPELVYVMADASLMERVMHNFVSNALIHTPPQTAVTIQAQALADGKVKISVIDSGNGISEEDQKHLFDKYYRSRKSSGKQGTGLGLAIVNSEIGKGSEFWFIM